MKRRTTQEWLDEFERAQIPCGPINNVAQVARDPQVQARDMIVEVPHPGVGKVKLIGSPVKLSRTPARVEHTSPELGQHSEEVLTALLGLSHGEVSELRRKRII